MLDERDLRAVREIAEEVTTNVVVRLMPDIVAKVTTRIIDERVPEIIDERVPKIIDERVPKIIDRLVPGMIKKSVHDSEVMLLDEMERFDKKNERKFAEIQKDQRELKELYRMIKNEQETITMMLKQLQDHEVRITRLETQTA
ncbi:MAG: hypothetical protein HFI15_00885 [Lachnospiraceae bacterium]|jgi:hypothetical protein|nr:hypothetical protein [Lachnospiraceae bacterium]